MGLKNQFNRQNTMRIEHKGIHNDPQERGSFKLVVE